MKQKKKFGLAWLGLALFNIKPCWLFNAKSSINIYIKWKSE